MTGALHFQVDPCAAKELLIDPPPESALYPEGARLTDLKELRDLVHDLQARHRAECAFFIFTFLFTSSFLSHLAYANDTTSSLSLVGVSSRLKEKNQILSHNCGVRSGRIRCASYISAILLRQISPWVRRM